MLHIKNKQFLLAGLLITLAGSQTWCADDGANALVLLFTGSDSQKPSARKKRKAGDEIAPPAKKAKKASASTTIPVSAAPLASKIMPTNPKPSIFRNVPIGDFRKMPDDEKRNELAFISISPDGKPNKNKIRNFDRIFFNHYLSLDIENTFVIVWAVALVATEHSA